MFSRRVTPEAVRDRLIEEHSAHPHGFFLELGRLLTDFHDFQASVRKIARGKLFSGNLYFCVGDLGELSEF